MSSKKSKSSGLGISAFLRTAAEVSGVAQVARAAVEAKDALEDKFVDLARKAGASDAQIRRFHALVRRGEDVQSALAIAFPFIANPRALRALAGVPQKRR